MTRIIGVGSPFGADRLAWQAIDHLADLELDDCELLKLDRPGSGLLSRLRRLDKAVVIDAVELDAAPGGVSLLSLAELRRTPLPASSHGFGLAETLALGERLGELPPTLHLIGIHTGKLSAEPPELDVAALERLLLPLL